MELRQLRHSCVMSTNSALAKLDKWIGSLLSIDRDGLWLLDIEGVVPRERMQPPIHLSVIALLHGREGVVARPWHDLRLLRRQILLGLHRHVVESERGARPQRHLRRWRRETDELEGVAAGAREGVAGGVAYEWSHVGDATQVVEGRRLALGLRRLFV